MKIVNFGKNFTTTISGFFQYDYGQIIDVYDTGAHIENLQFEFIQDGQQISVFGTYIPETDSYRVRIPDTFLQRSSEILTYIYYEDENKGQTIKIIIIKVSAREKFEDIPDPEHKGVLEQILEMLDAMQEEIDNWTISPEQLQAIVDEVEASIDLNDYYDKQETDTLLASKANTSDLPDMFNYYTKSQTDNLIPDVSGFATKTELSEGLATKANSSDVYTKAQVDNLIPDISGLATKTELQNGLALKVDITALSDYYTKQQTYSQSEINALISTVSTLNIEVVNSLPTQNISTTTIYLIPSQDPETSNIKDEYINLDGTSQGWELIGTTDIDLTNYVTLTQLSTILNDYVTSSGLSTVLADYATLSDLTTGLATKANASDVYTKQEVNNLIPDVSSFATTTQLNNGLALKANSADVYAKTDTYSKSEVYNKTEIDATLGNIQTILEAI